MWVLSALIFILWGFCPMVLLSILAFLCPPTWSHDENVDCPHLYHVITWPEMRSYTLIVGVLKYFLFWGFCPLWFLSFGAFVLWCFCPFWLFSVCPRDRMTRMLIVHTCIMWSHDQRWDRTPWLFGVLKHFLFWGFCPLWFLSFGFCPYSAFVHFCFSLSTHVIAWRECWLSTPVSCDHMTRDGISYTLIVGVLKYFLFLGVLSALIFILWWLLSYGAFVHFGFSLSAHVITWRECWLSTPVSCDHMTRDEISYTLIVGVLKYFHLLGFCVRFDFYPLVPFVLWCFCPFLAFLCPPTWSAWRECWFSTPVSCDHMFRDGIWSYTLIVGSIKIFSLLGFLSALIFILWSFSPMVLLSILAFLCPPTWSHDENVDCPHLYHVITWPEMESRTPWLLEY